MNLVKIRVMQKPKGDKCVFIKFKNGNILNIDNIKEKHLQYYYKKFCQQEKKSLEDLINEQKITYEAFIPKVYYLLKKEAQKRNKYYNCLNTVNYFESLAISSSCIEWINMYLRIGNNESKKALTNLIYPPTLLNTIFILITSFVLYRKNVVNISKKLQPKKYQNAQKRLFLVLIMNGLSILKAEGYDLTYLKNLNYILKQQDITLDNLVDTDNLSEEEIRLEKVNLVFEALDQNPFIKEEYHNYLNNLKPYLIDNVYIDLDKMYQDFKTYRIYDFYNYDSNIAAVHFKDENVSVIYENLDSQEDDSDYKAMKVMHETIHHTGTIAEYPFLNEGITSCLEREYNYQTYEDLFDYRVYKPEILATRFLTYLVSKDTILQAYSEENVEILLEKLDQIYKTRSNTKLLMNILRIYVQKYPHLTEEDKNLIKEIIELGTLTQEQKDNYAYYLGLDNCYADDYLFNQKLKLSKIEK